MCAPCKIIINQILAGIIKGIERVLTDKDIHEDKIHYDARMELIDRLRAVDLATFTGYGMPLGGLKGIISDIERYFPEIKDVWNVLNSE